VLKTIDFEKKKKKKIAHKYLQTTNKSIKIKIKREEIQIFTPYN
jgi:hypothetical protein